MSTSTDWRNDTLRDIDLLLSPAEAASLRVRLAELRRVGSPAEIDRLCLDLLSDHLAGWPAARRSPVATGS